MRKDDPIKVLLPAKNVPSGATVTKATGEKVYVLSRNIYADVRARPVCAAPDTVFLIDANNVRQVHEDTVVGWWTTPEELWDVCGEELEDQSDAPG